MEGGRKEGETEEERNRGREGGGGMRERDGRRDRGRDRWIEGEKERDQGGKELLYRRFHSLSRNDSRYITL